MNKECHLHPRIFSMSPSDRALHRALLVLSEDVRGRLPTIRWLIFSETSEKLVSPTQYKLREYLGNDQRQPKKLLVLR
jgi:hypothetical protein